MRTTHTKLNPQRGQKSVEFAATMLLSMVCLRPLSILAETVYRCGESYSTSHQCANATATEVKPSSVLHTTAANNTNHDAREAQALETQRRQAERQATHTAPAPINTQRASPTIATPSDTVANHQRKHTRKPTSPYFTAVDPNATHKKKNTAKAVPAVSNP
jgi:hypothetical protein